MHHRIYYRSDDIIVNNEHSDVVTQARVGPLVALPVPNSSRFTKSMFHVGDSLWNHLPVELRCISDKDMFKVQHKRYLLKI